MFKMRGWSFSLRLLFVHAACVANAQDCGPGSWNYTSDVNLCYKLVQQSGLSWPDARTLCVNQGGDLGTLSTVEKHKAAVEYLRSVGRFSDDVLIGLYYPDLNGPPNGRPTQDRRLGWKWTDSSSYTSPLSWSEWEPNEPGGGEPYSRLRRGEWLAIGKSGSFQYALCQKKSFLDCGDLEWQYVEETKVCYNLQISSSSLGWVAAEDRCRTMDGHLATPSTADQHDAVVKIIKQAQLDNSDIWIGLQHQNGASGSNPRVGWKWLDDSSYGFMAWEANEPGSAERYVRMRDGMWWGISQGSYTHFLCQKDPIFVPATSRTSTGFIGTTEHMDPKSTDIENGDEKPDVIIYREAKSIYLAVLSLLLIPVAICIVFAVIYFRRKQSRATAQTEEEHYCDIKDSDLYAHNKQKSHVYYNENVTQEKSQHSSLPVDGNDYYNDITNYEKPDMNKIEMQPVESSYTQLQLQK